MANPVLNFEKINGEKALRPLGMAYSATRLLKQTYTTFSTFIKIRKNY